MKKLRIILLLLIILIPFKAEASTNTYTRTREDLGVSNDIELTESRINTILNTPKVEAAEKVYDFADLFTEERETDLYNSITSAINKTNFDIVVVTININNKKNAQEYAQDFYDYNDFGKESTHDGLLLLIDMDTREIWISTTGNAILMYDDNRIETILDDTYDEVSVGKYYQGAEAFVEKIVSYYNQGIPKENSGYIIDEEGNMVKKSKVEWAGSILAGMIISFIIVLIMIKSHKKIKPVVNAHEYLDKDSIRYYAPMDTFTGTFTTSKRIPQNDSSSSSKIGGSSISRGSSGRSHGGGGRKF